MKYYLHDTSAFYDEKISELYIKYGYEGVGLFYTLLEKLALQEKPVKTDVLKSQLNVGKKLNKVWLFMEEIDLISSRNGETFNKQLLNFSEKYQVRKEKNRIKVANWRAKQEDVTSYVPVSNLPKVKESKVNNIVPKGTVKNKPMEEITYEPLDGVKKKTTFGRYPAKIAKYYCELVGKRDASAQLKPAKRLMQIALEDYPDDTQDQHFVEIKGRIKAAKKYYTLKEVKDWNLGKVAENWDKILKEWSNELDKHQ